MKSIFAFIIAFAVFGATVLSVPTVFAPQQTGLYGQYWQDSFFGDPLPLPPETVVHDMPIMPIASPTADGKIDAQIDFGSTHSWDWRPFVDTSGQEHEFSVKWSGMIHAEVSGTYWFRLESDDGSWLFINGALVINNGGAHPRLTVDGSIDLAYGANYIIIDSYETADFQCGIDLLWKQPGDTDWTIVPTQYFINPIELPNVVPSVPEFSLALPMVISLAAAALFIGKRRWLKTTP